MHHTVIALGARPLRDARAIQRAIAHETQLHRTLWAQPQPRLIIIRTTATATGCDWTSFPGATATHTTQARLHHPAGTRLHWALIANPTRNSRDTITTGPDGRPQGRGTRHGIHTTQRAEDWARRKLEPALHLDQLHAQQLPATRGAEGLTLTRWSYSGTATVADPAALARLLADGVGRGKAFGCGLLLVDPR